MWGATLSAAFDVIVLFAVIILVTFQCLMDFRPVKPNFLVDIDKLYVAIRENCVPRL